MFVGILPADVSLLAGVALGLLGALQVMNWLDDISKGRPEVSAPLSETIAALIDLDRAHADAVAKEAVAAQAKADHDAAVAGAQAKHQQLRERLAAAYPIPQASAPAPVPTP